MFSLVKNVCSYSIVFTLARLLDNAFICFSFFFFLNFSPCISKKIKKAIIVHAFQRTQRLSFERIAALYFVWECCSTSRNSLFWFCQVHTLCNNHHLSFSWLGCLPDEPQMFANLEFEANTLGGEEGDDHVTGFLVLIGCCASVTPTCKWHRSPSP